MLNYVIYFCKCAVEIWLDCKQLIQQVYHFRQMHSLTQATLLLLQGPVSLCMSPNLSKARSCISKSSLQNWPYSFPHIYKSPVASLTQFTMFFAFIYIYYIAWHLSFPDFIKSIATLTGVLNGYPSIHFYQVPGEISWAGISWIEFKFSITIITKLFMWFTPQSIITGNYPAVIKHMLLKLSQIESTQTDKKMQIHCVDKRTSQPNERH